MPDATPAPSPSTAGQPGALRLLLKTLLTYPRRPWLWSWPLGTALLACFISSRISPMYDVSFDGVSISNPLDGLFFSAFLLGCTAGFLAASVTGHFAQLLTPPRGQVVPRLRRAALSANILLTAFILLGAATIWPLPSVTLVNPEHTESHAAFVHLHALALAAVLVAQLAWTQFAPVTGALSLFAWGVLSFPAARDAVARMLLGQAPALETALAVLAATLFVTLWTAIARRRDRSYQVDPIIESLLRKFSRENPPVIASPPSGSIPALAPPRPQTARARLRLHRHAASAGVPAAVAGLLTGTLLVLWVLAFRLFGFGDPDPMTPRIILFMASIIPVMLVTATAMENRGPLLTHGLLLPEPRPRFIRELGLAMLANLLTAWVTAILPVLAWAMYLTPDRVRPTLATLLSTISIAAGYQLFAFGAIAWILRLTHRIAITFALAAVCGAGVLTLISPGNSPPIVTITYTSLLIFAGLLFTFSAYARWAHAEPPSAGPSKTAAAL